jgi:sporulation protein YlmC with PRC-barrel domain
MQNVGTFFAGLCSPGVPKTNEEEADMLNQENRTTGQDPYVKDTHSLIASDKVEGTKVYGADGKRIGSIQRILLEKREGRVAYAVLSFGGFLGIGDDYYPLPWNKLAYDEGLDGYRIDLTKDQITGAPRYADLDDDTWYRANDRRVDDYYSVPPTRM